MLVLAGLGAICARSWGDAVWNGTADSSWFNATNWSTGVSPGSTIGTTNADTATFNNSGGGHTAVSVASPLNVGNILFDTSNAAAYTLSGASLLGSSGGQVQVSSSVVRSQTINNNLAIEGPGGSFTLLNNATGATLDYGGSIAPVAPTASGTTTLYLGGSNNGGNLVVGGITDTSAGSLKASTSVIKTGSGLWELFGNDTYSGETLIYGGNLIINAIFGATAPIEDYGGLNIEGTVSHTGALVLGGGVAYVGGLGQFTGTSSNSVGGAGTITVDNTSSTRNNRLGTRNVALNGADFTYISGIGANSESFGTLSDTSGANSITIDPNPTGSTVLVTSSFTGSGGNTGTLLVTGQNLGGTPGANTTNLIATALGAANVSQGGGGADGTNTISIENFAVGRDLSRPLNSQYGFVTGATNVNGLRLLTAAEYSNAISNGASSLQNISLTLTANLSNPSVLINSLRLDTNGGVAGSGGLTVNSGAILALSGNAGISVANLNFVSSPAIFTTIGDLNLSGGITSSLGLIKTGPGTLNLNSGALNYSGTTAVNQGTIRFSAVNQLPYVSEVLLSGGSLNLNGFSQTFGFLETDLTAGYASTIYNPFGCPFATVTVDFALNSVQAIFGSASGSNFGLNVDCITQSLWLDRANIYTGPTDITSGNLQLDFSLPLSPAANVLPASTHLNDAGIVILTPGSSQAVQSLNGITINPGAINIREGLGSAKGGTLNFAMGAITRNAGGAVDLIPLAGGAGTFTTTNSNINGILGGYITFNDTDFAAVGANGLIGAATYANDVWTAGANVTVTTSSTQSGAIANSLRFAAAAANTVTLSGTNTLSSGGILISSALGNFLSKITGGTLEAAAGQDLIINNWNTTAANALQIDSVIADNGGANALTIAGVGVTTLTGNNTYTGGTYISGGLMISSNANLGSQTAGAPVYINRGTLSISASVALENGGQNKRPIIVSAGGGALNVPSGDTLTLSGPISGLSQNSLKLTGQGITLVTAANSYAGIFNLSNGLLQLGNANAAQNATIEFSSTSNTLRFSPGITNFAIGSAEGGATSGAFQSLNDTAGQPVNLTVGGNNESDTLDINLGGSGSFIKTGTGTLTLTGAASYSGTTTIKGGAVVIASANAIPSGLTPAPVTNNASLVLSAIASTNMINGTGTTTINAGDSLLVNQIVQTEVMNNGSLVVNGSNKTSVAAVTGNGSATIGGTSSSLHDILQLTPGSGLSVFGSLTINAGSSLDLLDNEAMIHNGSLVTLVGEIAQGFRQGTWTGTGIISSTAAGDLNHLTAIGYRTGGTASNPWAFDGLDTVSTDVILKYTYFGDANLDGFVNGADYQQIDNGFGSGLTGWFNGDFNYDGVVNGSDFALIDNTFNQITATSAGSLARVTEAADLVALPTASAVPEPAMAGLVCVGAMVLRHRRRWV